MLALFVVAFVPQSVAFTDPECGPEELLPVTRAVVLEGRVVGAGAAGALVLSSAGGRTLADVDGAFWLEVDVPLDVERVQVTAVSRAGATAIGSRTVSVAGGGFQSAGVLELASGSGCAAEWLPSFGLEPGASGNVLALAVYDDGGGPALYVAGSFTDVNGVLANRIAKWDGASWSALGSGLNDIVRALCVHDDGTGPALYAGGSFFMAGGAPASRVARWNGTAWSALGAGIPGASSDLYAMVVHDDGSGPALHVGGSFFNTPNVKKWNGSAWSDVGATLGGFVYTLLSFDDGMGAALYAGGTFTSISGVAGRIARKVGSAWQPLAGGVNGTVRTLAALDDGGGPALYAAGSFTDAGGPAAGFARWDGASWTPLAGGHGTLDVLTVLDGELVAGGDLPDGLGGTAPGVGRWTGAAWERLGGATDDDVLALGAFDAGDGPELFAGGGFVRAGGVLTNRVARLHEGAWDRLEAGPVGLSGTVYAFEVFDDGTGPALYVGGGFWEIGGVAMNGVARWDGSAWSPVGGGTNGRVSALRAFDDGSGPALYAGGTFTTAGGVAASRIARWDGSAWSPVGGGFSGGTGAEVRALAVFDGGGGPRLFACGNFFESPGATGVRLIGCWDGAGWSAVGTGVNIQPLSDDMNAMVVHDDGNGPALYVGGDFGIELSPEDFIVDLARWDGTSWSHVAALQDTVLSLASFDDGTGAALYAGYHSRVRKFDSSGVTHLPAPNGRVSALLPVGSGPGAVLYAGGGFTSIGGVAAQYVARWDGTAWAPLASGIAGTGTTNPLVYALAAVDDGLGTAPTLWVGGNFARAIDSGDSNVARWRECDTAAPLLECPGEVRALEALGGPPGAVVHFAVAASDALDPAPTVVCTPPSGSHFPRGTTLVTCTATDAAGNEATCEFPVVVQPKARRRD